jgi:hypothetical protein
MWDRLRDWLDNPILVKHIRSRLRKQSVFSSLVVVVMLNLCLAYAGYELAWYASGTAAAWLLAMQVVILSIIGSGQVNSSVGGARVSGILDFHRVSPLTPTELTLGFFLGAPIREYVLFAATIPFTALCTAFGVPSFRGFVQLLIFVLTTSWTLHAVVLLNALTSRAKTPTGGLVGLLVFVLYIAFSIFLGPISSVNIFEGERRLDFFGISLPWLPVLLLYQLPVLPPPGRDPQDGVAAAAPALQAAGHRGHADLRHAGTRRDLAEGRIRGLRARGPLLADGPRDPAHAHDHAASGRVHQRARPRPEARSDAAALVG